MCEDFASHLYQYLMGGVGYLMSAALVESQHRKLCSQSYGLHPHSGIINIGRCRDDEPRMAILQLFTFPHLAYLTQRRGFKRQRIGNHVRFEKLVENAHLPLYNCRVEEMLRRIEELIDHYSIHFVTVKCVVQLEPVFGVSLRKTSDLFGGAFLGWIMLDAVNGKAGIVIGKGSPIGAQILFPLGAVIPEFGKVSIDGSIVQWHNDIGMGISPEAGSRNFLGSQASADLVPPLKYTHAHAAVFD